MFQRTERQSLEGAPSRSSDQAREQRGVRRATKAALDRTEAMFHAMLAAQQKS
jgi:hypothetical protein